jgi:beta-glucuronidase
LPHIRDGYLDYTVEIKNHDAVSTIKWNVTVRDGERTVARTEGEGATISGRLALPAITPWSPDNPKLYTVTVELENGDTYTEPIGVRSFTVANGQMCLNDVPIKLFGFNIHEDSPWHDMTPNPVSMEKDLKKMKEMGCNFVRQCHYPHDPSTYRLCDKLGLISWAEIPLYWFFVPKDNPAYAEMITIAKRQIASMVDALHNHTSIGFWSVSNENTETMPEIAEANRELVRYAKSLIPGGYAVHVCDRWPSEGEEPSYLTEDDVLCLNGYPAVPWNPQEPRRYNKEDSTAFWKRELPRLAAKYPHKPILISEFGYPALAGTVDIDWSEATQSDALLHEAELLASHPSVTGLCIWCWADHQWPPSGFHGLIVSPMGVVERNRTPKKSLAALPPFIQTFLS